MSITSRWEMFRGEDITLSFTVSPVENITGWTIAFGVAAFPGDDIVITKTATVTDGANGIFTVTIPSSDTAALDAGVYRFDARRTDSGNKATLADGTIVLRREIIS